MTEIIIKLSLINNDRKKKKEKERERETAMLTMIA